MIEPKPEPNRETTITLTKQDAAGGIRTKQRMEVYEVIQQRGNEGVSQQFLSENIKHMTTEQIASHINYLVSKNKIQLFTHPKTGQAFFKAIREEDVMSELTRGLSQEQKLVYHVVQAADREGIWLKTLQQKTGLNRIQFPKIIKLLEQKKIIKPFKSITNKLKIFYILYNLQPADRHVGGIWYDSNGIFDRNFVEVLTRQCSAYIKEKGYATLQDVQTHIQKSGTSKVELREEHIKQLLNTLIFDGKVESFKIDREEVGYKRVKYKVPVNGLTSSPCGVCPVAKFCGTTTDITPEKCVYMTKWLEW